MPKVREMQDLLNHITRMASSEHFGVSDRKRTLLTIGFFINTFKAQLTAEQSAKQMPSKGSRPDS